MKKPFEVLFLLIAAFLLINCGGGGGGGGGAAAPSTTSTNETTTTTSTSSSSSSSGSSNSSGSSGSSSTTPTYIVKHLQQNVSGSGYTEVTDDRQTLNGTTGAETIATANTYIGFTAQNIVQQTIEADSSTVVEIRYNRDSITYTFMANGGNWSGSTSDITVSGLYGASVSVPTPPTKTGWFGTWDTTVPSTFGANDAVFTAVWYFGTKVPTEAKAVGDIVFKDGSATPYTNGLTLTDVQKNAAVAVIFYKGTGCSNNSSIRTLGIGLKHSSSPMKWCLDTANGHDTNISTIQCHSSGSAGAYTFTGDKNGSDNLLQLANYLGGRNDTGLGGAPGTEANYPSFYWAKNYGASNGFTGAYANGWYLPSIAELYQIWNKRADIDAVVALCGFEVFLNTTGLLWSSSQDYQSSRVLFIISGEIQISYKSFAQYVCAIREF